MSYSNNYEWLAGRYAALSGGRRKWFASAAWKRGYRHGKQEWREISRMNSLSPDLREL